jgi:hypothetical protein
LGVVGIQTNATEGSPSSGAPFKMAWAIVSVGVALQPASATIKAALVMTLCLMRSPLTARNRAQLRTEAQVLRPAESSSALETRDAAKTQRAMAPRRTPVS